MPGLNTFDVGGCCCPTPTICGCSGVPATLHGTHSVLGAFTVTQSGTTWSGTSSYSYPAFTGPTCNCPAKTIPINWTLTAGCAITYSWPIAVNGCPDPGGAGGTASDTISLGGGLGCTRVVACSPFSLTFTTCQVQINNPCNTSIGQLLRFGTGTNYGVTLTP